MSFEFIKNIVEGITKLDVEVEDYKKIVQNPYIPAIAYVNWGLHLAECGNLCDAEEKLITSTLMVHQTPEAYINLGVLKCRERKFEEAKSFYIKAIRLDRNSAKAFCFLGNVLTEMQDYKEAEKKFAHASKLDPNNSDINLNWGISLVRQRKFDVAKQKFELACKFNGANFTALYFLGLVDLELGDIHKAKEKFKMIISVVPSHYESFYYLAYINHKEMDYEQSLSNALKSLEIFTKKMETYMLIAECYMHLENEQECFKYYELGEKECNANYFFYISWGISFQRFGNYQASLDKFQKAIELDVNNELGYAYSGISYYKMNDYDNAIHYLQKALEINPLNIVALDNIGLINMERQNYSEAIVYFERVLKNSAKSVENYAKIANAYFLDDNIPKSNEFYKKALEYQPNDIQVHLDFAKVLVAQGDYEFALKKLQNAYKLDDKNLDCLNQLFYVNYILAKENISDYNIERAMEVANKLEKDYPDAFIYLEEKRELEARMNSKN